MNSPSPIAAAPTDRLAELQAVTADYARYAASAGGLSAVAGGALCLLSYAVGSALAVTVPVRVGLIAIPLVWLLARQLIARHYYQRMGRVEERVDAARTRLQGWLIAGVTAIVALIVIGKLAGIDGPGAAADDGATAVYLLILVALPLVAWKTLRNPLDLAIGAFLLCQAALAVVGTSYPWWSGALVFVPAALLMIVRGIRDQREFKILQGRMAALMQALRAGP